MSNAATARTATVPMTADERRATLGLAGIYGLRMLGMFIILPVFALFAESLPGGRDRTLVGVALGAYGLTQAVLQVPFGYASDRFGRKPVIYLGLLLFVIGSFVAAFAPDIFWVIVGRSLQGAGAISAAVIALSADLTREAVRTRTMAVIGITIGGTFAVSLIAGPLLNSAIGVPGIFALTGVLALGAMVVVRVVIPAPLRPAVTTAPASVFLKVLKDPNLLRLNYGIFALHALLMALFVEVPFAMRDAGLDTPRHWMVYLPVMIGSIFLIWPFVRQADRPGRGKPVFVGAVAALLAAQVALAFTVHSLAGMIASLLLFFAAFNLLEATLPALISRYAPVELKGTAIGVYSAVQFLGAFVGAITGGWLVGHAGAAAVFGFGVALTAIWLAVSVGMPAPPTYQPQYSMGET